MVGYKYIYRCPDCGNRLQFRTRVTMRRRRCPECGYEITPEEIDRQRAAAFRLDLILSAMLLRVVAVVCGGGYGVYSFARKDRQPETKTAPETEKPAAKEFKRATEKPAKK